MASEEQKHERYDFDFYFFGTDEEQLNYCAYTAQPTCCSPNIHALRTFRSFCFLISVALVVLQFVHYSWFYVAFLDCWSNISLCFAFLLLTCTNPSKERLHSNVWRGALVCHHFAWSGAWVAFIFFWVFYSQQHDKESDMKELVAMLANCVPIFLLLVEFFVSRLRFLHRMVLFVVILYLVFILINYIVTKVAKQNAYEPINFQTWTTLGYFVLYIVLVIAFFYLGYLLGEWKFCILKGGSAINAGDWSITESFSDTYATTRRSSKKNSITSMKAPSSRASLQSEFGRIGNQIVQQSPKAKRSDSGLFDKEMLGELNKAMTTNSTPISSFEIQSKRKDSGGL